MWKVVNRQSIVIRQGQQILIFQMLKTISGVTLLSIMIFKYIFFYHFGANPGTLHPDLVKESC